MESDAASYNDLTAQPAQVKADDPQEAHAADNRSQAPAPTSCVVYGNEHVDLRGVVTDEACLAAPEEFFGGENNINGSFHKIGEHWIVKSGAVQIQATTGFLNNVADLIVVKELALASPFWDGQALHITATEASWHSGHKDVEIIPGFPDAWSNEDNSIQVVADSTGQLLQPDRWNLPFHCVHLRLPLGVHMQINRWSDPAEGFFLDFRVTMSVEPGQRVTHQLLVRSCAKHGFSIRCRRLARLSWHALPLMMWTKAIFMQWSTEAQMQTAFNKVTKITAHLSRRAALDHGVPPHFFHGNRLADEWVKKGAKAHPMNFHVRDRIRYHRDQVTLLARCLTEVMKFVHRLGYPDVEAIKERSTGSQRPPPGAVERIFSAHVLDRCPLCSGSFSAGGAARSAACAQGPPLVDGGL
ncbi:unnamed protein product [Prorocentrum cordatum]|uniref:Beta-galactosidase n=1 Tax=Prorocentrum cordatum TaxID=2364126 RepID=A0ABN9ULW7_9DINO|nr:unnamed protein product [Polarella glacialis]